MLSRLVDGPGEATSDIDRAVFCGEDEFGEVAECVSVCVVGFILDTPLEFIVF